MTTAREVEFDVLIDSFVISLQARHLAKNTVRIYGGAARALAAWLACNTTATDWPEVTRADVRAWVVYLIDTSTPGNASNNYRAAQQMFKFLLAEDEIEHNPMAGMTPPKLPEKLVPVLTEHQLKALFTSCAGKDLVSRRDLAILRLFTATGLRLAEMAGLMLDDVSLADRVAVVVGKGDRERAVRFDAETAMTLDRYLRLRKRDKWADRPELWLAEKSRGPLTRTGIYQLVVRRGEALGLDINPHQFRHTFSHRYLSNGGAEGDLMQQAGWKSPQMVRRYGASARAERARTNYDRINVMGDL